MSRRRIYEEMGNPPMTSTDTKSVVATVAELRKMATSIYIAAEESVADDISARLTRAADLIERLSTLAPVDTKSACLCKSLPEPPNDNCPVHGEAALAPVDGGMELETTRQEQIWLRDMFDEKAPRFTSGEIAKTEEVLQRYHRDFDRLLSTNARLTALLAAEKERGEDWRKAASDWESRWKDGYARAEQAEAALTLHAGDVKSLSIEVEDLQAELAAERAARVKAVEALRTIAGMAHNKDLGRYALQVNIEAVLDDAALTQGATP